MNLCDLGSGGSLIYDTKSISNNNNTINLDFINICILRNILKKVKREPSGCKTIFINYVSEKRHLSRIDKELLQLNN